MDRYHQFEQDLVSSLEQHMQDPFQSLPLDTWNPRKTASPERHVQLGLLNGNTINQIRTLLETQNASFNDIESLLGLRYTVKEYTLHPVAEQVWLWGATLLSKYLQLLTMPGAIRSDFYRAKHDKLLILLKTACCEQPEKRPTFYQLIKDWTGKAVTKDDVFDAGTHDDDGPAMISPQLTGVEPVVSSLPPPSSSRLVLNAPPWNVERNKTRRNPRN